MLNENQIMVCIHCMTYNHEKYLADALEGFVMQKTDFPFVAVVIDDCSTDGTADVLRRYEEKYPDIIKAVYLQENYYSQHKSKQPFLEPWDSKAKYIALCEGDDYWTDPMKLQKQVDILEAEGDLMAVVTNSSVVDQFGKEIRPFQSHVVKDNVEGQYNLRDYLKNNHKYPTATVIYRANRKDEIQRMREIAYHSYFGDWNLWFILHILGDFYYLNQVTSAYRINPTSLTNTKDNGKRQLLVAKENFKFDKRLQKILPLPEYEDIYESLNDDSWNWIYLCNAYRKRHRYISMTGCLIICFIKYPKYTIKSIEEKINKKPL